MADTDVAQPTSDQPPPLTPQSYRDLLKRNQPTSEQQIGSGIKRLGDFLSGPQPNPFAQIISHFGLSPAQQPAQPAQQPAPTDIAPAGTAPVTPPTDPAAPKDVKLDPEHPDQPAQPQPEQRYLHSTRHPPSEWGKTPWAARAIKNNPDITKTSHMPSHGTEAVSVVSGASRQLATWGFPQTQQYWGFVGWAANVIRPFMDFYSGGAFGRAYDANTAKGLAFQREAMEINHQRMLDAGQYAIAQDNAILSQYRELVAEWQSHAFSKNDDENTKIAETRMKQLAVGDPLLQNAIVNGGLKGGMNIIQQRHQQLVDNWLAMASLGSAPSRARAGKTVKEDSELDQALGAGSINSGSTGAAAGLPGPPLAGEAAAAAAPVGSAPVEEGDENENVLDQALLKRYPDLGPTGIAGAHEILQTGKFQGMNTTGLHISAGKRGPLMTAAAEDMRAAITKEANSKDSQEDKIARIKAIDGQYGSNVEKMSHYQLDPKDDKQLAKLAASVNPDYHEGNYKNVQEFYSANKPYARMMLRQDAFPGAGLTLLKAIHDANIPEDRPIVLNYFDKEGSIRVTGDPKYSNIISAVQSYVNEYAGILSAQGTPRVSVIKDLQQVFKAQMSPAQLRNAVKIDTANANRLTEGMKEQWRAASGSSSDPPGWNPHNDAITQGIIHMNADRGTYPMGPETPNELKAISNPENTPRPPWMTDKKAAPPLTAEQRTYWENWLKTNPPDTPYWREINERLGINR
jgi:hypothetical protein